jgi:hypothetical protein
VVGRSQRLRLNYRTTAQNLAYALSILDAGTYLDLEETRRATPTTGRRATGHHRASWPAPPSARNSTVRGADTCLGAEAPAPETIAVLVRDRRQRERLVAGLAERGRHRARRGPGRDQTGCAGGDDDAPGKGTEFTHVLLFGVTRDAIPSPMRDQQYDDTAARTRSSGSGRCCMSRPPGPGTTSSVLERPVQ